MEDAKRAPSPPVSTKDSPGQQHGGEGIDPTSFDSKKEPGALPSSTTSIRHESVDELVDDCDIPETIVEVPDEDDGDVGDVHDREVTNLGSRPVLLQPLLSDDARGSRIANGLLGA
jgi:hypothetical protein